MYITMKQYNNKKIFYSQINGIVNVLGKPRRKTFKYDLKIWSIFTYKNALVRKPWSGQDGRYLYNLKKITNLDWYGHDSIYKVGPM